MPIESLDPEGIAATARSGVANFDWESEAIFIVQSRRFGKSVPGGFLRRVAAAIDDMVRSKLITSMPFWLMPRVETVTIP